MTTRSPDPAALLADLRGQGPQMAALLERLARAESPSEEPEAQRPVFAILAAELEALGYRVRAVPEAGVGDHLLAEPAGRPPQAPYQLLLGHMDTVWPRGTLATMPVREEDGRLHGPGVFDMKGGLVVLVFALRALSEAGAEPELRPVVLVNSDEEIGSPSSREHVERLAAGAARALVLEPAFGPEGRLKTARKGVGRFTLHVTGRATHAGVSPEEGVSAILELSHQVQQLFALNDLDRGVTVNVGTIDGGMGANVIAPEASAVVEVRVPTEADARELEHAIRGLRPTQTGVTLSVEGGFHRPPLEPTARNRALWDLARSAGRALGLTVEQTAVGGASDGNLASRHTATLDGLGPVGDGAHAAHEQVELARLPERAALLALLLLAPAGAEATGTRG